MAEKILQGKKYFFFFSLYFSDVLMYFLSVLIASSIFFIDLSDFFYARFFLFTLLILIINYSAYKLYKDKRSLFDDNDFMGILYSVFITYFVDLVFLIMFDPGDGWLFLTISFTLVSTLIFTSLGRYILYGLIHFFRKLGHDRKRVLFYGSDNRDLVEKIKENESLGYELLGSTDSLAELKKNLNKADIVFLTKEHIDDNLLNIIMENDTINWKIVSSVLNLVIDPVAFDEFKDYPIINISPSRIDLRYKLLKRAMDLLLSGIALLVLAIPFLVIAAVIKITMPGPVFFRHERLGRDLKPFRLYKFRSMIVGADKKKRDLDSEVEGLFKLKDDPRVTKFGKFLRRTCIDELPQLINIFMGDMSIVGPRPHLQIELENFKGWRMARFRVKPGLTGLWQVSGRHEVNFDKAVLYDIYYIKHMSFFLDISIILKTIPSIITSRGRY